MNWKRKENEWRKQLLSHAKGSILEVGVATGENFKFYPKGVNVTATDMSARVIEKARGEAAAKGVNTTFIVSPVEELQLKGQRFDTVVSTFMLSAYEKPGEVIDQFNDWCKPDGKILLLEYGLSRYRVISWLQKKWNPFHYKKTGYHLDRDMMAIISASALDV
ncbi:MAG TPA: class I SAM-dependent methyltransferase, partial [Chitinophagaceae bacterium]|nr:class I SAM-dependent methyltransferase [Chitinophagaceae bacterium]